MTEKTEGNRAGVSFSFYSGSYGLEEENRVLKESVESSALVLSSVVKVDIVPGKKPSTFGLL